MNLFNFFKKSDTPDPDLTDRESFVPPNDDDAIVVDSGGHLAGIYSLETEYSTENEGIEIWRELSTRTEIDVGIQEIVNEAIISDSNDFAVSILLDNVETLSQNVKDKVVAEFDNVLKLTGFKRQGNTLFRTWFVDGKIFFHLMIDENSPSKGIVETRRIDPKSIKKVIEMEKGKRNNVETTKIQNIYFVYNSFYSPRNKYSQTYQQIRVSPESIAYGNSGIFKTGPNGRTFSISYLDRAVKPANQLKMLEDAVVIYRIARAPERRVFYIDTGNLPKTKAEQYMKNIMNRFRQKIVYDQNTGEIKDQKNTISILEDYWLPRREGGRGTEISTQPGGQNLGEMEDVNYFYRKLYRALNVPSSRLGGDSMFNLGRSSEITREEVKFQKFIANLRNQFLSVFISMLRTQVVLKKIMSAAEFDEIVDDFGFKWEADSYWEELKYNEMWQTRLSALQQMDMYRGKYFSADFIYKTILNMDNEQIAEERKKMDKEKSLFKDEEDSNF